MSLTHSQSRFAVDNGALGWMFGDSESEMRTPEQRLMLAMVERAIRDFIGGSRSEARDAESWLFAPLRSREAELFSFAWVCSELNLDHEGVLARLKATLALSKRGSLPFFLDKRFIDRSEQPPEPKSAAQARRSVPKAEHLSALSKNAIQAKACNKIAEKMSANRRFGKHSDAKRWM